MEGEPRRMTATPSTPPLGHGPADRARLAAALRESRRRTGLTGTQAGTQASVSHSKVSKIERGFLLPSVDDVAALCRAYKITGPERRELITLATGLRQEQSARVILARGVAENQRRIGQLEAASTLIRGFQPVLVDGLLQTEAYMRLVFGVPGTAVTSEDEVAAATEARRERQRMLDDEARRFELIMSEGAIRWHAGSGSLMAEQTRRSPRQRNVPTCAWASSRGPPRSTSSRRRVSISTTTTR